MKLLRELSPVSMEIQCESSEEFQTAQVGNVVTDAGGVDWKVELKDPVKMTITCRLCLTERVPPLPRMPNGA
jgi:hypothetical protein